MCDDGPAAYTPMPADCVIPTSSLPPPRFPSPSPQLPPTPTPTLPANLAPLPSTVPWHGRTVYTPPAGSGAKLIGIGPDDTLYVLIERALPSPKPTASAFFVVPDVAASVIAVRSDGSIKPGWPEAGTAISGFPWSLKVGSDGTVFVAGGANPFRGASGTSTTQLTITAIGPDGKVMPGWPYKTPAAMVPFDPELLTLGPGHSVCVVTVKPGASTAGYNVPMNLYCVGGDGKLVPGWPLTSAMPLMKPAVGPDGTVYVAQITSTETSKVFPYAFPYAVLALGHDGKPKPGWTPWVRTDYQGLTSILPTRDGRVFILLGGDGGRAQVVLVDDAGRAQLDHVELGSSLGSPNYKDALLTGDGRLFVAVTDQMVTSRVNVVNAYSPDGAQLPGWPQMIGGWGDVAVSAEGSVWVSWEVVDANTEPRQVSAVARFDRNGNLAPGYPMACDYLSSLFVASDGTAYATSLSRIIAFGG
jgi:hypothetical protein